MTFTRKYSMAKALATLAATMALTVSCNDSYPGMVYEPDPDDFPTNEETLPVENTPIKIYTRDPGFFSLSAGTRSTGPFDPELPDKYTSSVFRVFAFRVGTGENGTDGQGLLTNPVDLALTAYSSNTGIMDTKHTSCLIDGTDYWKGAPFQFIPDEMSSALGALKAIDETTANNGGINGDNNNGGQNGGGDNGGTDNGNAANQENTFPVYYYSADYQNVGYNFFCYHIDDFKPNDSNTRRQREYIEHDIDINGYRDIMVGAADPLIAEDFEPGGKWYNLNLTEQEVDNILSAYGGYSTFSGHRNITPVVKMRHMLNRISFLAYPGDKSANDVRITGISINAPAKATLRVAGRKYDDTSLQVVTGSDGKPVMKQMYVTEPEILDDNGNVAAVYPEPYQLKDGGYTVQWEDWMDGTKVSERPVTKIGGDLMLVPQERYELIIDYVVYKKVNTGGDETIPEAHQSRYIISPPNDGISNGLFREGVKYNIRIAVYGLQEIEVSAAVEGWKNGGTVDVDPDGNEDPDNGNGQDPDDNEQPDNGQQ